MSRSTVGRRSRRESLFSRNGTWWRIVEGERPGTNSDERRIVIDHMSAPNRPGIARRDDPGQRAEPVLFAVRVSVKRRHDGVEAGTLKGASIARFGEADADVSVLSWRELFEHVPRDVMVLRHARAVHDAVDAVNHEGELSRPERDPNRARADVVRFHFEGDVTPRLRVGEPVGGQGHRGGQPILCHLVWPGPNHRSGSARLDRALRHRLLRRDETVIGRKYGGGSVAQDDRICDEALDGRECAGRLRGVRHEGRDLWLSALSPFRLLLWLESVARHDHDAWLQKLRLLSEADEPRIERLDIRLPRLQHELTSERGAVAKSEREWPVTDLALLRILALLCVPPADVEAQQAHVCGDQCGSITLVIDSKKPLPFRRRCQHLEPDRNLWSLCFRILLADLLPGTARGILPCRYSRRPGVCGASDEHCGEGQREHASHGRDGYLMHGLYAIVDVGALRRLRLEPIPFAEAVLSARPAALQLRDKVHHPGSRETFELLRALSPLCRSRGVPLFANDRADLAMLAGCDGVHVGQQDLPGRAARAVLDRGAGGLVGISAHNETEVLRALDQGPDYVALGPVFGTKSKERPDPTLGVAELERLSRLVASAGLPTVSIGGIDRTNAAQVASVTSACAVIGALLPTDEFERGQDTPYLEVSRRASDLQRLLMETRTDT